MRRAYPNSRGLPEETDEPIRTYKKGPASRLGFASATEIKDDIILFDAKLSFCSKIRDKVCMNRMMKMITAKYI